MEKIPIDVRHLQALVALRDSGSMARAAAWLNLTQGALSHHIKAIEDFHGAPLFVRKSSPVVFSPAGKRLLEAADAVLPLLHQASRDLARMAQGARGTLRIALECHTCFEWLMPAVDAFRARWPDIEVDLVAGYQSDPVALLHEGRADIALVNCLEPQASTEFFHLLRYRLVAILANDHPLAQKKVLEAEDFRDATLVTYPMPEDALTIVRHVLKPAGIPFTRRTMALTVAIVMLVSSSRGIAVLPRSVVQTYLRRKYVSARPITEPGLTAEVWAATRTEDCDKPYLLEFMTLVRETSAAHLADMV